MINKGTALSAVITDGLTSLGVPGAGVLSAAIQELQRKRLERAREILLEEIEHGDKVLSDAGELDEIAAILYRYARAAQEGAARINLRLMAKVILGQAKYTGLIADEFLYYADVISSLRYEEIILLGTLYRHWQSFAAEPNTRASKAQEAAQNELVPQVYKTVTDFTATLCALMRTGLISGNSAWGGMVYQVTPFLERIYKLAPFEAALDDEDMPLQDKKSMQ